MPKMAAKATVLKFFKRHLLYNCKLDWTETWLEASARHRNLELLNSFRSDIQDGRHGGHLDILQTTIPTKPQVGLSQNLVGCYQSDIEIQNFVSFRYPKWPLRRPSWKSSNHIFSRTLSQI